MRQRLKKEYAAKKMKLKFIIWKLSFEIENAYIRTVGVTSSFLWHLFHFIHCQLIVLIREIDKLRELKLQISMTFRKMMQHFTVSMFDDTVGYYVPQTFEYGTKYKRRDSQTLPKLDA